MSTESNTKKRPRFTFFDILIAVVIVAALAIVAYVLVISPMKGSGADQAARVCS